MKLFSGKMLETLLIEQRRYSEGLLPEIIKRLINCSEAKVDSLRIPDGDDVWAPGYDGIVEPNENLIWDEYAGIQHIFCRDDDDEDVGIICELFAPTEDGTIHVENIPFEPSSYIPTLPGPFGQLSQPQKTEEDYKEELEEFIASSSGCGYYEFNIANLRPGECRWFSHGMLIKPVNGIIKVHYQIHSARSMGDLEGTLEMNTD